MADSKTSEKLQQELLEAQRENRVLEQYIQTLQGKLEFLQKSRSWKITRPLRTANRLLRKFLDRGKTNDKTILMIDQYAPEPDRDAGSRSMSHFIQVLVKEGYAIKFWPEIVHDPIYTQQLERAGVEFISSHDYSPLGLAVWLKRYGHQIKTVFISRPDIANKYLPALKKMRDLRIVYYGHDIHHHRTRMQAAHMQDQTLSDEADRLEEVEKKIWGMVDHVLYPSSKETIFVHEAQPEASASHVIPYAFDALGQVDTHPGTRKGIIFIANYGHSPNIDAAMWLVNDVMPRVWQRQPDVPLYLVGSYPPKDILALASDKIIVTGAVSNDELKEYYRNARVAAVPLRFGAGIKLKVVEALNHGLPLVTTSVGAQGMDGLDRVSKIESGTEGFATALLELLNDDAAWQTAAAAQLEYARANFSFDVMRQQLLEAIKGPQNRPAAA